MPSNDAKWIIGTLGALMVALGGIIIAQNAGLGARMDRLEARMDRLETRLDSLDARLRAVEVSFGRSDQRLVTLERILLPGPADEQPTRDAPTPDEPPAAGRR